MSERWVIEKMSGPKKSQRWLAVACSWSQHDAEQMMFRYFFHGHRVKPLESEWPRVYSGSGDGYDKGEFD